MTQPLGTVRTSLGEDSVTVTVSGEIDLSNAAEVEEQLVAAIPNQVHAATLDLSDVEYIDSIGMRILFRLAAQLDTAQISLTLRAPLDSPARRVIEVAGLPSVARMEPPRP